MNDWAVGINTPLLYDLRELSLWFWQLSYVRAACCFWNFCMSSTPPARVFCKEPKVITKGSIRCRLLLAKMLGRLEGMLQTNVTGLRGGGLHASSDDRRTHAQYERRGALWVLRDPSVHGSQEAGGAGVALQARHVRHVSYAWRADVQLASTETAKFAPSETWIDLQLLATRGFLIMIWLSFSIIYNSICVYVSMYVCFVYSFTFIFYWRPSKWEGLASSSIK